uniref:Uncharacterized protein n=1 Tax=Timema douglasi TaxID=61478 RepID=A0A7R8VLE3_TIMDO|nr:unnamed protein product [Timema douglasi]
MSRTRECLDELAKEQSIYFQQLLEILNTLSDITTECCDSETFLDVTGTLSTVDLRSGKTASAPSGSNPSPTTTSTKQGAELPTRSRTPPQSPSFLIQGEAAVTPLCIRSYSPITSLAKVVQFRRDSEVMTMPREDQMEILRSIQELTQTILQHQSKTGTLGPREDAYTPATPPGAARGPGLVVAQPTRGDWTSLQQSPQREVTREQRQTSRRMYFLMFNKGATGLLSYSTASRSSSCLRVSRSAKSIKVGLGGGSGSVGSGRGSQQKVNRGDDMSRSAEKLLRKPDDKEQAVESDYV